MILQSPSLEKEKPLETINVCPHCRKALNQAGEQELVERNKAEDMAQKLYQPYLKEPNMLYSPIMTAIIVISVYCLTGWTFIKLYPIGDYAILLAMIETMTTFSTLVNLSLRRQKKRDEVFKRDYPKEAKIILLEFQK